MVYSPTSPKQCFCTTLHKHKNSIFSLNVIWLFYWKLQKHVVHELSIDSFIPLSKQPRAGVRNVLPSREHMPANAFSTRWQQRQQHFAADRSKRKPVAAWVRQHCVAPSHTHAAAWPPNLVVNGVQVQTVGGHSFGEMKPAVSRCRSSIISRARCAGALSCWQTKLSPATCLITGIICCDRRTSWEYLSSTFTPGSTKKSPATLIFDTAADTRHRSCLLFFILLYIITF